MNEWYKHANNNYDNDDNVDDYIGDELNEYGINVDESDDKVDTSGAIHILCYNTHNYIVYIKYCNDISDGWIKSCEK